MYCPDAFALYKRGRGIRHTKQARPSTETAGSKTPRVRGYSEGGRNYPWMLAEDSQRTEPLLERLRLVDVLAQLVQLKAEDDATADQREFGVDDKVIAV